MENTMLEHSGETFNTDQAIMLHVYVDHPLIKEKSIDKREFQVNIAKTCLKNSSLVVLPTGMGKTIIALLVIAERLKNTGGKILFLAPTKPLTVQHHRFLEEFLKVDSPIVFTGEVAPAKRKNLWRDNQIIVSTPQVIQNDLIAGRISLDNVSLIIFDEAHKSVGNYAYVYIGEQYLETSRDPLILGMTASPGYDPKKIIEICENLHIESVEIRSEYDPDVMPYVFEIDLKWVRVDIPPTVKKITTLLRGLLSSKLRTLRGFGLIRKGERISTKEILDAQKRIQARIHNSAGRAPRSLFQAAIAQAAAMKINHAIELAETQGTSALVNYLNRLEAEAGSRGSSKAAISIAKDSKFKNALVLASNLRSEHPKLAKSVEIVKEQLREKEDSRIIVFTHYRETSDLVMEALNRNKNIRAVRFIGQASKNGDKGLRQKEQVKLIEQFKEGIYNVLVATSVAEEGLDIPSTDLVVFYEPIPSEIRTIQRRGRTGRRRAGKVVILITRDTRDEAYHWTSRSKEKRMKRELQILREELRKKLKVVGEPETTSLMDFKDAGSIDDEHGTKFNEIVSDYDEEPDDTELELMRNTDEIETDLGVEEGSVTDTSGRDDAGIALEVVNTKKERKHYGTPKETVKADTIEKKNSSEKTVYNEEEREDLNANIPLLDINQSNLGDFIPDKDENLRIIADTREFNSNVARRLSQSNVKIEPLQLGAGDYIISERVAVERKKSEDLLGSLMDGRLFSQLKKMKALYLNPILIIEGANLFADKSIHPDSVNGALASIITDFRIPIINTKNELETVKVLMALARREQGEDKTTNVPVRTDKNILAFHEQQQFIVEGLPGISATLAQRLLSHFGSVRKVFDASVEELCEVKGVGKKIAVEIRRVIDEKYQ